MITKILPYELMLLKNIYVSLEILNFDDDGLSFEFPDLSGYLTCSESTEEAVVQAK